MKFSEQWLREWVNPAIKTNQLVEQITMAGLEVDGVEPVAGAFHDVVVAQVMSTEKHPDADKLSVCQVSVGPDEVYQVVCGAPNVRAGLKVPFAKIGAVLPGDFRIKKAKLRGVESSGMLCAAAELGLAESSDGLLELPNDAPVGQDVRSYLKLDDHIIEVDLTPNRSDCLSIAGLAREVGVLNRVAVEGPAISEVEPVINDIFPVQVEESSACPRYLGRVIKNVNLSAETPLWMQEKLRRSGLRSIDPAVDVTNYVMLELGQPMHAFDLEQLSGTVHVRNAKEGEKLVLLDGQEITLRPDTLVIADHEKALALAGIMGGEGSGVSENTRHIFLECAFFAPLALAGKARSYGLHTDSSHRFERGVDYKLQRKAVERATRLLLDIVGGEPGPVAEVASKSDIPTRELIELRHSKLNSLLGLKVEKYDVEEILTRLGLHIDKLTKDGWKVNVPSYRFDIEIEVDLIEEVGRVYGYNNLPVTEPVGSLGLKAQDEAVTPLAALQNHMVALGYEEAITYSFVDPELQSRLEPGKDVVKLANPISSDLSVMRTNLWAGLLKALGYNQNRQQGRVRLFETGLVFLPEQDGLQQTPKIGGLISGSRYPENWVNGNTPVDFFDAKSDIESLLAKAGVDVQFARGEHSALHPGQTAEIVKNGKKIGMLGAIHPELHKYLDLNGPVYLFELCLNEITKGKVPVYQAFSRFPEVKRDMALVIDDGVLFADVEKAVMESGGEFFRNVSIFDVYKGKGIDDGKKSLALTVTWQHQQRTLNDEEVAKSFEAIIKQLEDRFGAKLRS